MIHTKFKGPPPGEHIIGRTRLFQKLDSFHGNRLILVMAPPGYGKTTLLSSWKNTFSGKAEDRDKTYVCWLSLDEGDDQEDSFFSHFFRGFYNNPSLPENMKENAVKRLGGCTSFHGQHLLYFINDLSAIQQEIVMIADDFQFVTNQKILQALKFLLEKMPSNMHLVLSGRTMSPMELAKQRMYGNVLELNEEDLAFSWEETKAFLDQMKNPYENQGIQSSAKDIYRKTEGWPAGVQLMASVVNDLKKRTGPEAQTAEEEKLLPELQRQMLYDYLMEEVFLGLKEEIRKFLVYTSLPDSFTVPLCNELLGIADSPVILEEIKRKNVFLWSFRENGEEYRYHKMFREFLLKQFSGLGEAVRRELTARLVSWYERERMWEEAVTYSIKGRSYEKAVSLIEKASQPLGCRGQAHILHKWNKQLPPERLEHNPRLLLNSAWAALAGGRRENVRMLLKKLPDSDTTAQYRWEIAALHSSCITPIDRNLEAIFQESKEAARSLPEDEFLSMLLCFNIGTAALYLGNLSESRAYFEKCRKASLEAGEAYLSITSNYAIARHLIQTGQIRDAQRRSKYLLREMEEKEKTVIPAKGLLYASLAEIRFLQQEYGEARQLAEMGLELGRFGEDYWTMGENLLVMAKIDKALDKREQLERTSEELKDCINGRDFFDLEVMAGLFFTEDQIENGRYEEAYGWLQDKEELILGKLASLYPQAGLLKTKLESVLKKCHSASGAGKRISSKVPWSSNPMAMAESRYSLSIREKEILRLMGCGDTNAEIGDKLCISVNTVKTHILNIFGKLEVNNRSRAVALAEQMMLL